MAYACQRPPITTPLNRRGSDAHLMSNIVELSRTVGI